MKFFKYLLIVLSIFAQSINPALAEHEIDHRYEVMGFVLDKDEIPIVNSGISILMDKFTLGTGSTNSQGFYKIRLHLHDPDLGKELQIVTPSGTGSIHVEFTPGDQVTIREHHVNIVAGQLVEGPLSRQSTPQWLYIAGASIVVLGLIAFILRKGKKRAAKKKKRDKKKNKKR